MFWRFKLLNFYFPFVYITHKSKGNTTRSFIFPFSFVSIYIIWYDLRTEPLYACDKMSHLFVRISVAIVHVIPGFKEMVNLSFSFFKFFSRFSFLFRCSCSECLYSEWQWSRKSCISKFYSFWLPTIQKWKNTLDLTFAVLIAYTFQKPVHCSVGRHCNNCITIVRQQSIHNMVLGREYKKMMGFKKPKKKNLFLARIPFIFIAHKATPHKERC